MTYEDDNDELMREVESTAKKTAKKQAKKTARREMRKISPFVIILAILLGVGGFFLGKYGYTFLTRNDCFEVRDDKNVTLPYIDEAQPRHFYSTSDKGCKVIAFGQNLSDSVIVETNMEKDDNGKYIIDCSKPGTYYIAYTVDSPRFKGVRKVRTFTVPEPVTEGGETS